MADFVIFLAMIAELLFATNSASEGNVAMTMLYCFSAYICFQLWKKEGK